MIVDVDKKKNKNRIRKRIIFTKKPKNLILFVYQIMHPNVRCVTKIVGIISRYIMHIYYVYDVTGIKLRNMYSLPVPLKG